MGLHGISSGFTRQGSISGMQNLSRGFNIDTYRTGRYDNVVADQTFTSGKSLTSADDDTLYIRCTFNNSVGEDAATATVFAQGTSRIALWDCEVDGTDHSGGHGIRLSINGSCEDFHILNSDIHDFQDAGIFPGAGGSSPTPNHPGLRVLFSDIHDQNAASLGNHNLYVEANGFVICSNNIWNNKGGNLASLRANGIFRRNYLEINSRDPSKPAVGIRYVDSTWGAEAGEDLVIELNTIDWRTINSDNSNTSAIFIQGGDGVTYAHPDEVLVTDNIILTFPGDTDNHIKTEGAPIIAKTTISGTTVTETAGDTEILAVTSAALSTNGTSIAAAAPTGDDAIEDGDLLIGILEAHGDLTDDPISWTNSLSQEAAVNTSNNGTLGIATKIASSESGTYGASWTDTERAVFILLRCRGSSVVWADDSDLTISDTHTIPGTTATETGETTLFLSGTENDTSAITIGEGLLVINKLSGAASTNFGAQVTIDKRYVTRLVTIGDATATLPASKYSARGTLRILP